MAELATPANRLLAVPAYHAGTDRSALPSGQYYFLAEPINNQYYIKN